ncbi:hypothetical protein [Rhodococcus sp. IEGM 1302]|uniref:hypothetical protein n=1 Tax=Rhodococcus sp. IEGM 1302 TaxID=3047093 RepID=UPI0024B71676|nr:hypothetical protein [Rhodococcus sp. IEGM 1302]MDI9943269.1 hypothetical protein [Rhodococcus sp. IEGM 1302]
MSAALSLVTDDDVLDAKRFTDEKLIPAAKRYTDSCNELLDLVVYAYRTDMHVAMGFDQSQDGWQQYLDQNIGGVLAGVKGADRQLAVSAMSEAGMSTRTIAAALKVGKDTVARELKKSPVANATPAKGADGKTYTPKPKPEPIPLDKVPTKPDFYTGPMPLPCTRCKVETTSGMAKHIAEIYCPQCLDAMGLSAKRLGSGYTSSVTEAIADMNTLDYEIDGIYDGADVPDYDSTPPTPALAAEALKYLDRHLDKVQQLREQLKVWAGE